VEPKLENNKSEIKSFKIFSESINDTFVIDVSLPAGYDKSNKKYPVLFLTDGNWRKEQHQPIHDMAEKENIKELIIVGICYPSNYNFDEIRVRDLIVHPDKFLDLILYQIIPRIDSTYRTNGQRTLWGSSFGGFFALYTLFNYSEKTKDVFQNYIVASPAALEKTNFNGEQLNLFGIEERLYSKTKVLKENLYVTVGGDEEPVRFLNPFKNLVKILDERNYSGFYMKTFIDPGKTHNTVWEPTLYEGVRLFLSNN
jgi:hypothetical protein